MAGLAQDIAAAGRGLLRLVRRDPGWAGDFDLTARGFWLSFAAPLLALPLYVLASAVVARTSMGAVTPALLWSAAGAHLLDAFGFPLVLALLAGWLRVKPGYGGFVTVYNWASLYVTGALLLAALPALIGAGGLTAFELLAFVLLVTSVFVTARAARETLSRELAPIALVVVLSVASGAMADQAMSWLLGSGPAAGG